MKKKSRPDPRRRRGLALAAALACLPAFAAAEGYTLRYGLEPGQTWHAVQTVFRETSVGTVSETHTGTARFRYDVGAGAEDGDVRLDARMVSQETSAGASPFDFSVIQFMAQTDRRGATRGMHYRLGDAEPPDLPGVEKDPVAFRQMLRSLASAWIESVYWLPELPEGPIELGESFAIVDGGDVGGTDPGVTMKMETRTVYTLRKVTGRLAEFGIEVRSTVDAATAQAGITSNRSGNGEAVFDLEAGMWTRQEVRAEHRAALRGAETGDDQATARTTTTFEMRLGDPPAAETPTDHRGL
ncbi:MAG: hypothetical protein ACQGVC_01480 [Myxococcota bacterium]